MKLKTSAILSIFFASMIAISTQVHATGSEIIPAATSACAVYLGGLDAISFERSQQVLVQETYLQLVQTANSDTLVHMVLDPVVQITAQVGKVFKDGALKAYEDKVPELAVHLEVQERLEENFKTIAQILRSQGQAQSEFVRKARIELGDTETQAIVANQTTSRSRWNPLTWGRQKARLSIESLAASIVKQDIPALADMPEAFELERQDIEETTQVATSMLSAVNSAIVYLEETLLQLNTYLSSGQLDETGRRRTNEVLFRLQQLLNEDLKNQKDLLAIILDLQQTRITNLLLYETKYNSLVNVLVPVATASLPEFTQAVESQTSFAQLVDSAERFIGPGNLWSEFEFFNNKMIYIVSVYGELKQTEKLNLMFNVLGSVSGYGVSDITPTPYAEYIALPFESDEFVTDGTYAGTAIGQYNNGDYLVKTTRSIPGKDHHTRISAMDLYVVEEPLPYYVLNRDAGSYMVRDAESGERFTFEFRPKAYDPVTAEYYVEIFRKDNGTTQESYEAWLKEEDMPTYIDGSRHKELPIPGQYKKLFVVRF